MQGMRNKELERKIQEERANKKSPEETVARPFSSGLYFAFCFWLSAVFSVQLAACSL